MMYRLSIAPVAYTDIERIKMRLSCFYPGTPARFHSALRKGFHNIKTNPHIAQAYPDNPKFRRLVVGDYLVFYVVNEDKKTVEIRRILHGSQDSEHYI